MIDAGGMVFDTAIGRCGVSWRGGLITKVELLTAEAPSNSGLPPESILAAAAAMTALLDGEPVDLGFVELDLDGIGAFDRAVYEVTRTIPPGSALTYGQVAERVGEPGAAQAVGRSLGSNPFPLVVPCHRVLGAGGRLVGFSAVGGTETKRKLLLIEGCPLVAPSLFD